MFYLIMYYIVFGWFWFKRKKCGMYYNFFVKVFLVSLHGD